MDRRTLIVSGGALALTAATGAPAHATAPEAVRDPMFSWEISGGFVPPGVAVLVAPPLVVYAEGMAVVDAARTLDLRGREVRDLREHATEVLRDKRNSTRRPGAPIVADVPFDNLSVRDRHDDEHRASLEGWTLDRERRIYPRPMYELYDHVAYLRTRVRREGRAFRPDAVLLVFVYQEEPPERWRRWPEEIPVPRLGPDRIYRERRLFDRQARVAKRHLRDADDGVWPVYRSRDGRFFSANWRYLLPHDSRGAARP